ncbi:MAG: histidinol-phosphatase [Dehalococcoidia bacterium]|nr:histidinol-phosphatase [Dehalococcoidia bacterium]
MATEAAPTTAEMLAFALDLADEADRLTMQYYRGDAAIQEKADGSLVTRADQETEAYLRRRILGRFPDHAILGEEEGFAQGADASARWVIDPVDGTHGFARGVPVWATLIAFERDRVFEVGVASAPALGTRWWAGRGLGAYRGALPARGHTGERIAVSDVVSLGAAQVLYGSYRLTLDAWEGRTERLLRGAWRTRGFGDFWSHCLVAEGAAEVMLEGEISPWDIAALLVIVEEAGGRLTDIDGNATIEAGHCITTNGALHEQVLRTLRGEE